MECWKYCPKCSQQSLVFADKRFYCDLCGFVFYFNTATAVAAFIEYQDKIILVRRGEEPSKGMLDLPGGFVDYDETAEDALIREIREELSLEITSLRFLTTAPNRYPYENIIYPVVDLFFTTRLDSLAGITPQDDVADHILVRPCDIQYSQIAFESTCNGIAYYLKTIASGR